MSIHGDTKYGQEDKPFNPSSESSYDISNDKWNAMVEARGKANPHIQQGAISGQQNDAWTAHESHLARQAEASEQCWKNQAGGNQQMKATVDAMPMGKPPNPANPLSKQIDGGHYKGLKIQPIEFIHANNIPFAEGCAIKYLTRWRSKGGIKDLEKAKHFIELLIELESRK